MVNMMNKNNQPICKIDEDGDKQWILNGRFHREDGPAIEYGGDDYRAWYLYGQRHRIDGPAVVWGNGDKYWYYHGKHINCSSQKEFERLINLKALW